MTVVDLPQPAFANARRLPNNQPVEGIVVEPEFRKPHDENGLEPHPVPGNHAVADRQNDTAPSPPEHGDVSKMVTSPTATKAPVSNPLFGKRRVLYATAAVVVLSGIGMATMLWEMNKGPTRATLPSEVGAGPVPSAPLMAPSAQIAHVPAPAVPHFVDTRSHTRSHPSQPKDQLQEMLAARNSGTPISVPVVVGQAPSAFPDPAPPPPARLAAALPPAPAIAAPVSQPAAVPPPATTPSRAPDQTSPRKPAATPSPIASSAALGAPNQDAADQAARLQSAPMTSAQEVSVLHLVTEEASMIRRQRQELADLHAKQDRLTEHVDGAIADFGRRLELAEATRAVADAGGPQTIAPSPARAQAPVRHVMPPVVPLPIEPSEGPHHYRVQAASPHLAMLADADQPQEAAGLAVSVGDPVPGFGHVTAISQRGTQWVVKTDHGLIQ